MDGLRSFFPKSGNEKCYGEGGCAGAKRSRACLPSEYGETQVRARRTDVMRLNIQRPGANMGAPGIPSPRLSHQPEASLQCECDRRGVGNGVVFSKMLTVPSYGFTVARSGLPSTLKSAVISCPALSLTWNFMGR